MFFLTGASYSRKNVTVTLSLKTPSCNNYWKTKTWYLSSQNVKSTKKTVCTFVSWMYPHSYAFRNTPQEDWNKNFKSPHVNDGRGFKFNVHWTLLKSLYSFGFHVILVTMVMPCELPLQFPGGILIWLVSFLRLIEPHMSFESQKGAITFQRCYVENQNSASHRLCTATAHSGYQRNIFENWIPE